MVRTKLVFLELQPLIYKQFLEHEGPIGRSNQLPLWDVIWNFQSMHTQLDDDAKNAGDHKQNKIKNKKTNLKQKSNSTNFQNKKLIKTDRIWKLVTELKEKPVKSDNCWIAETRISYSLVWFLNLAYRKQMRWIRNEINSSQVVNTQIF